MSVWYRSLVLVGLCAVLTSCVDNAKMEEAVAEAEAAAEKAKLALAKGEKKLADTEAAM